MNTFTLGACFQHELHTGPYFMTFAPRLMVCTLIGNSSRPISARRPLSYCKNFVEKTNKPKLLAVDRLIATTTKHIYNPHSNNTPI